MPAKIAAFLRNHVHDRAVGVALGGDAAALQRHFLDHVRVDEVPDVPARMVDRHAVELPLGARLAVIGVADVLIQLTGDIRKEPENPGVTWTIVAQFLVLVGSRSSNSPRGSSAF